MLWLRVDNNETGPEKYRVSKAQFLSRSAVSLAIKSISGTLENVGAMAEMQYTGTLRHKQAASREASACISEVRVLALASRKSESKRSRARTNGSSEIHGGR